MDEILIIDDNEDIRNNFAELLGLNNYEVHVAGDGLNGLLSAKKELPDIILCDIQTQILKDG